MSRYRLIDEAPNNAVTRCFGVWDSDADDYAVLPNGELCYGMTLNEARLAEECLRSMCQCTNPPYLYRYRGDPEWWSCSDCDRRVVRLTSKEQPDIVL